MTDGVQVIAPDHLSLSLEPMSSDYYHHYDQSSTDLSIAAHKKIKCFKSVPGVNTVLVLIMNIIINNSVFFQILFVS